MANVEEKHRETSQAGERKTNEAKVARSTNPRRVGVLGGILLRDLANGTTLFHSKRSLCQNTVQA